METWIFEMMKSKVVLFGDIETFCYDFGQIFLLQSIVASLSIIGGQDESNDRVCKLRRSIIFE